MIRIKKILFPTDFSECSNQVYHYALDIAKKHRAELTVLHTLVIFQEDPNIPSHHFSHMEDLYRVSEDHARNTIQSDFIERAAGVAVHYEVARGFSAADEILDYAAEQDMDLIVMGTHGHSGFRHFFWEV